MAFLKRNLFYIILVVATVALCGVIHTMVIQPKSKANRELVEQRTSISSSISTLKKSGVNREMVDAEKRLVEAMTASTKRFQDALDDMNRAGRDPLTIRIEQKNLAFPAFPVDRRAYAEHAVRLRFASVYRNAMRDLFNTMNATQPPQDYEIASATTKMRNYMLQKEKEKAGQAALEVELPEGLEEGAGTGSFDGATGGRRGDPMGAFPGAMDPNMGMPMPYMDPNMGAAPMPGVYPGGRILPGRRTAGGTGQEALQVDDNEVLKNAVNNLLVQKVQSPRTPIYADFDGAFDLHPLPDNRQADIAEMWKANVNYWIHAYVLDGIRRANERAVGDQPVTIANAAVKRLVSVRVGRLPSSRTADAATFIYEGEQTPEATDAAGGGTAQPMMDPGFGAFPGYDMGALGMPAGPSAASGGGTGVDTLTGRACTQQYDVVNFTLNVVVAANRLLEFQEALVANDFCTIQSIDLYDPYQQTGENATRGLGNQTVSEESYYYGPEPVVKVVMQIEFLMFTEWERSLMPVEMLRRLPSDALREADTARISEADAPATP